MKEFPIPVVALGAGSQPVDDEVAYLPLPSGMDTFALPTLNLEADPVLMSQVCDILEKLRKQMQQSKNKDNAVGVDVMHCPEDVVTLLNQSLGHGEVSVVIQGQPYYRIQETVYAGVWRMQQHAADGELLKDTIAAGSMPDIVPQVLSITSQKTVDVPEERAGMMNAPAILNELIDRSQKYQAGKMAQVINLSLLPMSSEDLDYLSEALGIGPVTILSRGYGNCRITSTNLAHVWWVQYFNSMDTLILNTLEVTTVPEVALAADEDYQDSVERLGEWLEVMREEVH